MAERVNQEWPVSAPNVGRRRVMPSEQLLWRPVRRQPSLRLVLANLPFSANGLDQEPLKDLMRWIRWASFGVRSFAIVNW